MTEPMKILFYCGGSYVYGQELSILSIMKGLQLKGFEVHCVTSGFNNGQWHNLLNENNITYTPVKLGKFSKSLRPIHIKWSLHALVHLPFALFKFGRIIKKKKPHVLFFSSYYPLFFFNSFIHKHPIILRHAEKPDLNFFLKHVLYSTAFPSIYHVGISNFITQELKQLGVPSKYLRTIYNGFQAPELAEVEIEDHSAILAIGFIGQITAHKGIEDLIEALGLLREDAYLNWRLYIAGSGSNSYLTTLKSRAKALEISQHITWMGYQNNNTAFFKEIDICIIPSRCEEAFGRVAAEASMWSKALVVTNKGALPEIVENNITGHVIPSSSPVDIFNAIKYYYNNPDRIATFGKKARNKIIKEFSQEEKINQYSSLVHQAISANE